MADCRDIMKSPVTTASPSMTLAEISRIFAEEGISGAPVVDHRGKLIGVVSQTDIVRCCMEAADLAGVPSSALSLLSLDGAGEGGGRLERGDLTDEEVFGLVEEIMSTEPVVVRPETPVTDVARQMAAQRIHRVIVVDEGNVVGIVTSLDLLGHFGGEAGSRSL